MDGLLSERTGEKRLQVLPEPMEHGCCSTVLCPLYLRKDWLQRIGSGIDVGVLIDRIVHDSILIGI
jgi:hypothetical protein